jgi:REP element-mobilizing transposase RayT
MSDALAEPPYRLGNKSRACVLSALLELCHRRGWFLWTVHVRVTHVHVVLNAKYPARRVRDALKAAASCRLKMARLGLTRQKRWSRGGSVIYLWRRDQLEHALRYVIDGQGEPMELYVNSDLEWIN